MKTTIRSYKPNLLSLRGYALTCILVVAWILLTSLTATSQHDYLKLWVEDNFLMDCDSPQEERDSIRVYNPATMKNEWIRLLKDGRIQHNPSGEPIYIDNSVIYTHSHTGEIRHATFSSGLWMSRIYDDVNKKPVGDYVDVSGYLSYRVTINNNLEVSVQNGTHWVEGITTMFGAPDYMHAVTGLPLKTYKNSNGWLSDGDDTRTGSLFTSFSSNQFRIYGDPDITLPASFVDQFFQNGSASHVLPAETSTFNYSIIVNDLICLPDPVSNSDLEARLYIGNTPSFRPSFIDPYLIGTKVDATPYDYWEFDIEEYPTTIIGGQYYFVITLVRVGLVDHYLHIPVVVERPTEAPRKFDHVTKGPLELSMVIHDPPGSESSATYEAGTTICKTTELSIGTGDGSNHNNTIQVGFSGSAGAGVSADIETTVGYTIDAEHTKTVLSTSSTEECTTITQTITTSSENGYYDNGDVFIGQAYVYQMYSGKRYFWDESTGETYESEGLYAEIVGRNDFVKNEAEIELEINDLCNALATAIDQGPNPGESQDEFDLRKNYIIQSMEIWYDMLAENKAIKADLSIPQIGNDKTLPNNGTSVQESEIIQVTAATTNSQEILTTTKHGVDATVLVAGNGYVGSNSWSTTKSTSFSDGTEESQVVTNIYFLKDGPSQQIEQSSVTVHQDPRFGNKFFRVKNDSRTSCPYEGGLRIDQPNIKSRIPTLDPTESNQIYISGVPAGTTVIVPIDVCNLFPFTNPNVTGYFRLVRELSSGNGANVELAANDPLENSFMDGDPFEIDFGTCFGDDQNQVPQNIFISQNSTGDLNYDESTDEIRLRFYSECDESAYDVLSISVRFTEDPNEPLNMNAECEFLQNTDRAMNFDGVDDRIDIAVKKQPFIFNNFSYEFWVKPEGQLVGGQSPNNTIPTQSNASTSGGFPFVIFPQNGRELGSNQVTVGVAVGSNGVQVVEHYAGAYDGNDIVHSAVVLDHSANINDWTHVAVVYKKRALTLYMNGVEVATGLTSEFLGLHPSFQLGGGEMNGQSNYFKGTIDDLRYWTYARTEFQIAEDMSNKLSGNEPGLVSLYLFDGQEPGGDNEGEGLIEYAGVGEAEDAIFYNFDYGETSSNWVTGRVSEWCSSCRGLDADVDGLPDACDNCPDLANTGLNFDENNDYIEIPHNSVFNLVDGDFSFEAWIYSDLSNAETILSKGPSTLSSNDVYIFQVNPNSERKIAFQFGNIAGGGQWFYSNTGMSPNQWNHVAVSVGFSGTNPVLHFYLNGVADGIYTVPFTPNNSDNNPLFIARQGLTCTSNCGNNFDGALDEVRIWDKALTQAEIQANMDNSLIGNEADLVAYYTFNEGMPEMNNTALSTVDDLSGNGHTGTLIGMALSGGSSNWVYGAPVNFIDANNNGIGDLCEDACPPDYANGNSLTGSESGTISYTAGGLIQSTQTIATGADVKYNAGTDIELNPDFEVEGGAVFHAYIEGCGS